MIINKIFKNAQKLLPNLQEKIGAPAVDEQIELLKKSFNFKIDPLLIEFWKRCNGDNSAAMLFNLYFNSIQTSIDFNKQELYNWKYIADNPELCKNQYQSKKRIAFMQDFGGSVWFLDYDPATQGTLGQVICIFRDFPETIYNVAPSFEAFLQLVLLEFEENPVHRNTDYDNLSFDVMKQNMPVFWAQQSVLASKNKYKISDVFFTKITPEWQYACQNGYKNLLKNHDGIFLGEKTDALLI